MKGKRLLGLMGVFIALAVVLSGCETSPTSAKAGKIQINITDAPADLNIEQVWLTVDGVKIHLASNETVPTTTETTTVTTTTTTTETESNDGWLALDLVGDTRFNLLDYQNGLQAKLAVGDLAPGKYTQIRMDVKKVEIKLKGDTQFKEAKLPSNTLKFVHPFEIVSGQTTEITFDFDALKSISETGNGKYICKPVIKLTTTKEPEATGNLQITTPSLPNGIINTPYTETTLEASGGTTPYAWSISAGDIPTGLAFDGVSGKLSGTPTVVGTYTFTVKVEDSTPAEGKKTATKEFTVIIAP